MRTKNVVCIWTKKLTVWRLSEVSVAWGGQEWFYSPLDGMLVHRSVLPSIKFAGTRLNTVEEKGSARDRNTTCPVRARTRTARSGDDCANHEATARSRSVCLANYRVQVIKHRPNNRYIFNANVVTLSSAFSHPVATCCDMLSIANWTSAHAPVQHCCKNLGKRVKHRATSNAVAWKIWPYSNLSQQHPLCPGRCNRTAKHV